MDITQFLLALSKQGGYRYRLPTVRMYDTPLLFVVYIVRKAYLNPPVVSIFAWLDLPSPKPGSPKRDELDAKDYSPSREIASNWGWRFGGGSSPQLGLSPDSSRRCRGGIASPLAGLFFFVSRESLTGASSGKDGRGWIERFVPKERTDPTLSVR